MMMFAVAMMRVIVACLAAVPSVLEHELRREGRPRDGRVDLIWLLASFLGARGRRGRRDKVLAVQVPHRDQLVLAPARKHACTRRHRQHLDMVAGSPFAPAFSPQVANPHLGCAECPSTGPISHQNLGSNRQEPLLKTVPCFIQYCPLSPSSEGPGRHTNMPQALKAVHRLLRPGLKQNLLQLKTPQT